MVYRLLIKTISGDLMPLNFRTKEEAKGFIMQCQNEENEMIDMTADECNLYIRPKYIESIRMYEEEED